MDSAAAGVLHGIETLAEGALIAAKGIYDPTLHLKATFHPIRGVPSIPRSSHTISVVKNAVYIFGGEVSPRQPVDNAMHMIVLPSSSSGSADYRVIPAKPALAGGPVPVARVGHTAVAISNTVYVFGGRGGPDMAGLDEQGRVWAFDTTTNLWSTLDPTPKTLYPPPRSYHCSTGTEHPSPIRNAGSTAPEPASPNTSGTLFIHAGCLSAGGRAADLWAFDISSRTWAAFPPAHDAPRGGASLAISGSRLYRFGGFDGTQELGGQVDYLDLVVGTFDDKGGRGEMAVSPLGPWSANMLPSARDMDAEADEPVKSRTAGAPANRSVAGLVPITTGQGRHYLLMVCGEGTPSGGGHESAGRFLDDVWAFQLKPEGMTAASVKDAARSELLKKETGEAKCAEVKYYDEEGVMVQEGQTKPMGRRGWFSCADTVDALGGGSVVVWGGLNEENERLGDGWIITVE